MVNKKTLPEGFTPYGVVTRQYESTPPINWTLWGSMYDVELWQAAALSLNINPDTINNPAKFNHDNYKNRLRLLENWLRNTNRVMLCELAGKWSKVCKWDIPPELAALAKYYSELTKTETAAPATPAAKMKAGAGTSQSGNTIGNLAVFHAMSKLTADELSIAFVGDKPEPNSDVGANNFLEISARDATRRVALAALDLVKTQGVGLNSQGAMLLGFAHNLEPPGNEATAQIISRLRRRFFKEHLGVEHDPFDPKAAKWKPRFKITDKRGAADERAKREAERHTVSLEQMNERGERVGDINDYPYEDEDDAAGELLRN